MPELEPELALAPRADRDEVRLPPGAMGREEAPPSPVELLLDRLHGRWKWAIIVGLILAPLGAAAGYVFTPLMYTASGIVGIDRQLDATTMATPETTLTAGDFTSFVLEQTTLLHSDRLINEAMLDPGLAPYRDRLEKKLSAAITDGLSTTAIKGTGFISVEVEDRDPNYAAAAANALIDAYMRIGVPNSEQAYTKKLTDNRDNLAATRREIDSLNDRLLALAKATRYGTIDLQPIIDDRVHAMQREEAKEALIEESISRIEESTAIGVGTPPDDARIAPSPMELDQANPQLSRTRSELAQARTELEFASRNYSTRHPIYTKLEKRIDILSAQLEREQQMALEAWRAGPGRMFSYGELNQAKDATLKEIAGIRDEIDMLNQTRAKADKLQRSLTQAAEDERLFEERIKQLEVEQDAIRKGRVAVTNRAVAPLLPSKDRRIAIAVAGGIGGFLLSLVAFFTWGTVDKRTFGTRQLAGNSGKLLLAGAIPDMKEAENGEMKDLATNCVHRVRTRIESRRSAGNGYALMVSSAFQGDGKTTLAVALAWSYAESGYRTLLVDCDFIGQALSFQFGQLAAPGVREALQGSDPFPMIVSCGAPNLSILPVGRDRHFGASRVHPNGLRRLFRGLRNNYDIILVDTGPMTASIEALPVASSVDGVVLSLRRGRSRQRLEECIQDIASVGAEYLGVVLNYADHKDCMRYGSVSRLSVDVERALAGQHAPPPRHPLLAAIQGGTTDDAARGPGTHREGDAA